MWHTNWIPFEFQLSIDHKYSVLSYVFPDLNNSGKLILNVDLLHEQSQIRWIIKNLLKLFYIPNSRKVVSKLWKGNYLIVYNVNANRL